jgi:hypothetical protein
MVSPLGFSPWQLRLDFLQLFGVAIEQLEESVVQ